ncbi:ATP-grasp domain-containing protein [Candidatus Poribacteria bacterium]|nr:ATP-grasp domain-containing protein [Candidatus Poribacteria bacterium]
MTNQQKKPAVVLGGLSLIRPTGFAHIPVVMIENEEEILSSLSRYVVDYRIVNKLNEAEYVKTLVEVGERLLGKFGHRSFLVYGTDSDLKVIYAHADLLERYYLFLINGPALRGALIDKWRFYLLSREKGLTIPETVRFNDFLGGKTQLQFPIILKPRVTYRESTGREIFAFFNKYGKAFILQGKNDLSKVNLDERYFADVVAQQYIDGNDEDICSFHGFATEESEILACFTGKKIRTYPKFTGQSTYLELVKDEDLLRIGKEITKKLEIKGIFKIDFKKDLGSGIYFMLEINLRFNLWHHLGAVNGINLPHVAYEYLVNNRKLTIEDYGTRYRWCDFSNDCLAFRELRDLGEIEWRRWIADFVRGKTVYKMFSLNDPMPYVRWLIGGIGRRLGKWAGI